MCLLHWLYFHLHASTEILMFFPQILFIPTTCVSRSHLYISIIITGYWLKITSTFKMWRDLNTVCKLTWSPSHYTTLTLHLRIHKTGWLYFFEANIICEYSLYCTIMTLWLWLVCVLTLPWELLSQLAQAAEAVGSQLAQDAWQHLCQLLDLGVACDGEGVGRQRRLHFGVVEVNHCSIIFYHVYLRGETQWDLGREDPTQGDVWLVQK